MHELSIVTNVLETATKAAKQRGAKKLTAVNLNVGIFKQVVDDALQFSWQLMTEDENFTKGALLNVTYVEPESVCPECGCVFEHDMFHRKCPDCGCEWTTLTKGSELEISSIEIEEK